MHAGPFVLYHLAQIREQEIERRARVAWHRSEAARTPSARPTGAAQARLDAVAPGC